MDTNKKTKKYPCFPVCIRGPILSFSAPRGGLKKSAGRRKRLPHQDDRTLGREGLWCAHDRRCGGMPLTGLSWLLFFHSAWANRTSSTESWS